MTFEELETKRRTTDAAVARDRFIAAYDQAIYDAGRDAIAAWSTVDILRAELIAKEQRLLMVERELAGRVMEASSLRSERDAALAECGRLRARETLAAGPSSPTDLG